MTVTPTVSTVACPPWARLRMPPTLGPPPATGPHARRAKGARGRDGGRASPHRVEGRG